MSTRVGTLQGTSVGRSIWPAAVLVSLVMLAIAVTAISIDRDEGRPGAQTFVGRQVVNTPSELSAGTSAGSLVDRHRGQHADRALRRRSAQVRE